jgi:glutaredoxin-like protein DUF836
VNAEAPETVALTLYSRPECHLCEEMRAHVDALLGERVHRWHVIDVDSDPALAARYGDSIPVLFVNGRLFAKTRLPRLGLRLRFERAAARSS